MKKVLISFLASMMFIVTLTLSACGGESRYRLTVNGSEYLYESLNDTYKAGDEVSVKVKLKPFEGVKAALDTVPLVKSKSDQNDFWLFTFEMPSHDATLDIISYEGFDEPLLYGFYLTFYDKNGDPIEEFNQDVKSEGAIADYFITYYNEELGNKVFTNHTGADVFADGKTIIGNEKVELENTLYFTYELIDAVAIADWVYFDEETQEVYSDGGSGHTLNTIGHSSTFQSQSLSDIRFNSQMKEYEETFESHVKINFKYLDYLTGVKVLEYDANNQLIQSTEIAKSDSGKTHFVSEACEYAVIEEEYTVMNGETAGGEKHYERTLINKGTYGGGKTLKYPRGNGLIAPQYLSVKWQAEIDE